METITELREICQPANVLARYAPNRYRKVSIHFTKLFLFMRMSASHVTLLSLFVGLFSSLLFTFGGWPHSIFAALLLHFFMILDCCDGEVARYNKQSSISGVFLEKCVHQIVTPSVFLGIGLGIFNNMKDLIWLFVAILTSLVVLLNELVVLEHKLLRGKASTIDYSMSLKGGGALIPVALFFYSSFTRVDLIFLGALARFVWSFLKPSGSFVFDPMIPVIVLYGMLFTVAVIVRLVVSFRQIRKASM